MFILNASLNGRNTPAKKVRERTRYHQYSSTDLEYIISSNFQGEVGWKLGRLGAKS